MVTVCIMKKSMYVWAAVSFNGDCTNFQYSVDYGAWKNLTSDAVNFGGGIGDLSLRGKSETGTWNPSKKLGTISFGRAI